MNMADSSADQLFGEGFRSRRIVAGGTEIRLREGGAGEPLLLLHGYPQTHIMWHAVAPRLAERFHVICPDLRGYGDSAKPADTPQHASYAKRAMAGDMVELMAALGYRRFFVAGHDRGGRVAHRLALDHAACVRRLCVMDIVPTLYAFHHVDQHFATGYYHWFFLIQPDGLPEHLIGLDAAYYLKEKLRRWSAPEARFHEAAVAEYVRCFTPAAIHASCEDYRAAASIDLTHDAADAECKIACPVHVLWGTQGFVARTYDVLTIWRERAGQVTGRALTCGHFLAEEAPGEVCAELLEFFGENGA